ncbi:MAG TPA: hypothetical protein VFJ98_02110 [Mycobacteriales bacterium]|jgi:hypothetical protein|nr:hypothetical protein [Mycobacteriales bacterium]
MKMHLGYRGRHRIGRSAVSVVAASVAGAAMVPAVLIAGAGGAQAAVCPSPPVKCYKVVLSPTSLAAGSNQQLTAKLTNESGGQSLGSSNLTAPAGYTVTGVGAPTRGTATQSGNTIQLRSLALPVGQTVTVSFTVQAPSTTGSAAWTSTAKQSNDYNGTGNDFVLDPKSVLTTSTTSAEAPGCPAGDVSCGTNFIRYDQPSSVSTGSSVNSTVWNIARIDFPATPVTGGQNYSLEAAAAPGGCPVDGSIIPCDFDIRAQDIPAPYDAAHAATLTVTCDSSHCSSALGQWLVFKQTASGGLEVVLPCLLDLLGNLCFTATTDAGGDPVVTVRHMKAGDPKILGVMVG